MLEFLASFDALLCPASPRPAARHGDTHIHDFGFALPFSLTGWPAAVVRAGRDPEGLPIGVQIAAAPWRDEVALAAATCIERGADS